jgi:beta-galactosidase
MTNLIALFFGTFIALVFYCMALPLSAGDEPSMTYYPLDQRAEFSMSLNGSWKFHLGRVEGDFTKAEFDDHAWQHILVPGNWELQGFEEPAYAMKVKDTEGCYRRSFTVPEAWSCRRVFLRFEGVAFGYECWIDGRRVGAFSSPFNRSEYDITDLVKLGRPATLAVRVTRRDQGWDFDIHDDWSLSGIHREVMLFSLPELRLKDYTVTTTLQENGKAAAVKFSGIIENISAKPNAATLTVNLLDPQGKNAGSLTKTVTLDGTNTEAVAGDIAVPSPQLWTAETPALYTLNLDLVAGGNHVHLASQKIGLREITVADGVFKINGRPVKLHGVNHHDLDPETGRAMTREQYLRDLEWMKKGNFNAIRTCHYPPQKMFLDLCDEYGIYVLDEVPFGVFGDSKEHLSNPAFAEILALRARATVARDKNQACVVLWTVGNEIPYTPLVVKTAGLVKELDPSRPRCIAHPTGMYYFPLPPELSVVDCHYLRAAAMGENAKAKVPVLEDIFKRPDVTAPVLMSEFAHAQGASLEDLPSVWDAIESSDRFMGGCIWLLQDQGLYRQVPAGSYPGIPKVVDGPPLKFGNVEAQTWISPTVAMDTGGQAGKDGLMDSDRFPKSSYWAARKIFSPVVIPVEKLEVKAGLQSLPIPILNRYDITDLSTVTGTWELHVDGRKIDGGPVNLQAAPRTKTVFTLNANIPDQPEKHDLFLRFAFTDKDHYPIAEHTIRLRSSAEITNPYKSWLENMPANEVMQTEQGTTVTFTAGESRLSVDRVTGNVWFGTGGKTVFDGLALRVGRVPQMPELRAYGNTPFWDPYLLTNPGVKAVTLAKAKDGGAQINLTLQFNRAGVFTAGKHGTTNQAVIAEVQLKLSAQGWLDADYNLTPVHAGDYLLEWGLAFKLPAGATSLTWLGKGPCSVYPAQAEGMERGVYRIEPKADFDPLNRIYWGNRTEVAIAAATDAAGNGLGIIGQDATISLEPFPDAAYVTQVLQSAGHGEKRKISVVNLKGSELKPVSGNLRLMPLQAGRWPQVFDCTLGKF